MRMKNKTLQGLSVSDIGLACACASQRDGSNVIVPGTFKHDHY
jgi:hypothetical protein